MRAAAIFALVAIAIAFASITAAAVVGWIVREAAADQCRAAGSTPAYNFGFAVACIPVGKAAPK